MKKLSSPSSLVLIVSALLFAFLGQSSSFEAASAYGTQDSSSTSTRATAGQTPSTDDLARNPVPGDPDAESELLSNTQESVSHSAMPAAITSPSGSLSIFLPIVYKDYPPPPPIFGVETYLLTDTLILSKTSAVSTYWVRNTSFSWEDIEPIRTQPPTYHWEVVSNSALQEASERGLTVIATIKYTPAWAQKIPGVSCGPVAEDSLDEFAQFLDELVKRYSVPPYNIKYWEIGNEVDVDPDLVKPDSAFGCWGDEDDPYYGGRYYAEMLKYAYPAIKAADPQAKVMNGGLIVNCDPTYAPACLTGKYMEGILLNKGGRYLDIVNFHAYAYYDYENDLIKDENWFTWAHRGGMVLGKADYLRELMADYGIDKPLMNTESSLLCARGDYCEDTNFLEKQADYVVWTFARSMAADFLGTIWFTIEGPGWRNSGLMFGGDEKPAYWSYKFMAEEMAGAKFAKKLSQFPDLRAFEFTASNKRIWILWSPDYIKRTITLPGGVLQVFDKYGNIIVPVANQVAVKSPIYVEISP